MANTYSDATGVLMFDGPAKITPVIRMLFKPFKLDEEPEESGTEYYVAVLSEDNDYDWDRYLDEIADTAEEAFGINFQDQETSAGILKAIGAHFGSDLGPLVDSIDFDNSVVLSDVVQLALSLADGHNLIGLCLEGCWHCSKPRLWEFGGWASYASKRYGLSLSTSTMLNFAREMDASIAVSVGETAAALTLWLRRFIDGIADEGLRREVARLLGVPLNAADVPLSPRADTSPASQAQAAWTRTVYIEAYGTDEGEAPSYARLDVTPAFIQSLQALQALCMERGLTEVRIADAPDRWGPGDIAEDLRLVSPELVVTPQMFWFADHPKGAPYEIETRGQSIATFIASASDAGDPLFIGVAPEDLDAENPSLD